MIMFVWIRISAHMHFPLKWYNSLFILKNSFYFLENDLESATYFVLFLNGKQNKKKKKSKYDSLFGKDGYVKNQIWIRGLGYLLGRYSKNRNTIFKPIKRVSIKENESTMTIN